MIVATSKAGAAFTSIFARGGGGSGISHAVSQRRTHEDQRRLVVARGTHSGNGVAVRPPILPSYVMPIRSMLRLSVPPFSSTFSIGIGGDFWSNKPERTLQPGPCRFDLHHPPIVFTVGLAHGTLPDAVELRRGLGLQRKGRKRYRRHRQQGTKGKNNGPEAVATPERA